MKISLESAIKELEMITRKYCEANNLDPDKAKFTLDISDDLNYFDEFEPVGIHNLLKDVRDNYNPIKGNDAMGIFLCESEYRDCDINIFISSFNSDYNKFFYLEL